MDQNDNQIVELFVAAQKLGDHLKTFNYQDVLIPNVARLDLLKCVLANDNLTTFSTQLFTVPKLCLSKVPHAYLEFYSSETGRQIFQSIKKVLPWQQPFGNDDEEKDANDMSILYSQLLGIYYFRQRFSECRHNNYNSQEQLMNLFVMTDATTLGLGKTCTSCTAIAETTREMDAYYKLYTSLNKNPEFQPISLLLEKNIRHKATNVIQHIRQFSQVGDKNTMTIHHFLDCFIHAVYMTPLLSFIHHHYDILSYTDLFCECARQDVIYDVDENTIRFYRVSSTALKTTCVIFPRKLFLEILVSLAHIVNMIVNDNGNVYIPKEICDSLNINYTSEASFSHDIIAKIQDTTTTRTSTFTTTTSATTSSTSAAAATIDVMIDYSKYDNYSNE
jgi:hypothetical protein